MHLPSYEISESADDYSEFKFTSIGPKGSIDKVIVFQKLPLENLYNLSLLDVMSNGQLSDSNFSNNNDLRKILATTIQVLVDYTEIFPDRMVFFQGSDDAGRRNSLYQKAIAKYYSILKADFSIVGITANGIEEAFDPVKVYEAFLVKRL